MRTDRSVTACALFAAFYISVSTGMAATLFALRLWAEWSPSGFEYDDPRFVGK
ncbi:MULTISPECIES: hypothetical protein [unclassified Streptomyces]|uniref:hypothetical protein n=1 Tax=unclassified Streptomyces TaxID=2593676 RepID=UPI003D92F644